MRWKRFLTKLPIAFLIAFGMVVPARATSPFQDGLIAFNANRFHQAESDFEKAAALSPNDQGIFVMLGKVREKLQDPDGAKEAYRAAFRINPFNASGAAAKQAILSVTANIEAQRHQPLDDPGTMRWSAQTIQTQARELGRRYINEENAYARNRMNRWLHDSFYSWRNPGEISGGRNIRRAYRYMGDLAQAYQFRGYGYQRAAGVQQSANNLEDLLSDHSNGAEPHLRATGTNLYVRYYGAPEPPDLPPVDPPVELRAVAKKLSPGKWHG